jgi:hypothetical protein
MNTYAVYSDDAKDIIVINNLYNYFKQKNNGCDFHIFSSNESIFNHLNIASLSTFYMKFFTGKIIFCHIEDYLEYQYDLLNECYLVSTLEECINSKLNRKPDGVKFLKIEEDNVYEI